MPLPDTVVLRFVSAISDVENHLVSLAEGHKRDFLGTLSDRYGPEEAARGWLDEEPYLRFLITTYAGQFYGTMTRAIKAMKSRPKKAKRRGKKTVGFAFAAGRGHFLVKAFDPRKPMDPQAEQRISVERQRLDQRFLRALSLYRQQAVGCETYIWRSQDDDRVRARHAGYDDQEFPYSRPPEDGHPGQAYGCRCTAEPVWPDFLSDQSETLNPDADKQVSVLLTNIWLLLGSITLGGVLKIPKALGHAGRIVSAARTLLRSSQTLMGRVRDAQKRSALEKEQHAAQKSIEKMQTQVKEAAPKNPTGKTEKEIRDIAEKIAKGHSWDKHVIKKDEYPEIKTKENFSRHIKDVMKDPTEFHDRVDGEKFPRNREIYGDEKSGTVVIYDPVRKDLGTAFRPRDGVRQYIDDFLNQERNEIAKLKAKKGVVMSKMVLPHEGAKLIDWMTNNDYFLLSGSILIAASVYEWDPRDTGYSKQAIRALRDNMYLSYVVEDKPFYLTDEEIYALSHAHDVGIEEGEKDDYEIMTGHDFSEALALQKKLHAHLATMKRCF
jgi:hypothetical protein